MNTPEPAAIRIRPVHEGDAQGLAKSNEALNSPHAPTDPAAVDKIIASSQSSISGKGKPLQVNLAAEELSIDGMPPRIIGGGAVVKMGADGQFPILWRQLPDRSLERYRYTDPTLEFGGVSVSLDDQGKGTGKGISAARAILAKEYAPLFGAKNILSDFLPPLDDATTKENAFWDQVIVPELIGAGLLEEVMRFCEEKTGRKISSTSVLSTVIGNIMSDADRNEMIDRYFPQTIAAERITPEVQQIMENVNGPTQAARANLMKIYGPPFKIIGSFPINGGPNYAAPASLGPTGLGPSPLQIQTTVDSQIKMLIFRPLEEGFRGLRNFQAFLVHSANPSYPVISEQTATATDLNQGQRMSWLKL